MRVKGNFTFAAAAAAIRNEARTHIDLMSFSLLRLVFTIDAVQLVVVVEVVVVVFHFFSSSSFFFFFY